MEKGKKSTIYYPKYPQQNTFEFNEGIVFDSKFDSGNLLSVNQITDNNYEVFICADCEFNQNIKSKEILYRVWFYFSLESIGKNFKVTITITNLSNLLKKILTEGYTPVIKYGNDGKFERIDKLKNNCYYEEKEVGIDITLTLELKKNEKAFLSFSYPYSYSDIIQYVKSIKQRAESIDHLYFFKETLNFSNENRKITLLTITSKNKMTSQLQRKFHSSKNLFPTTKNDRPFQFDKKYILITCRVHPGETPASYALEGIINFLFEKNEITKIILDNYVFLVIPCLNPDGVYYGHYRLDINGFNLNRIYNCADYIIHPSIFGVKKLVENIYKLKCFYGFYDLHAHNNIDAAFMFGNTAKINEDQVKIEMIPKLISSICKYFSLENCAFKPKIRKMQNTNEETKEEESKRHSKFKSENDSIAKTYFYKMTGHPHCYTFECNYNGKNMKINNGNENEINQIFFDQDVFRKLGESLVLSIHQYDEWLDSLKENEINNKEEK